MRFRDFDCASGRIVWAELHGDIRSGLFAPAFEANEPAERPEGETDPKPVQEEVEDPWAEWLHYDGEFWPE